MEKRCSQPDPCPRVVRGDLDPEATVSFQPMGIELERDMGIRGNEVGSDVAAFN